MKHIKNLFLLVPLFIFISCGDSGTVQQDGTSILSKTIGTSEKETSHGLVIDSSDNIYLCGTSEGNLTLDSNTTHENFFIQKLSPNGDKIWIKQYSQIDGNIETKAAGITVDADDNLYVGGNFIDHSNSGGTSSGLFITKYDSNGSDIWFKKIPNDGATLDVIKFSKNKLYFSGHKATIQIDFSINEITFQTSMFVAQYSVDGEKVLEKEFANIDREGGYHEVNDMLLDADNNIYVAGRYISTPFDYPNGDSDLFIAKFSLNFDQMWINILGATDEIYTDIPSSEEIISIKIIDGHIYAIGTTHGNFDNLHSTKTMSLYSRYGIFMKFSTDGTEIFRKQFSFNNKNTIPLKLLVDQSGTFTSMVLNGDMNYYSSDPENTIIRNMSLIKLSLNSSGDILNTNELISDNNDIYYLNHLDSKYASDGTLITTSEKNKGGHFIVSSTPTDNRDLDVHLTIY